MARSVITIKADESLVETCKCLVERIDKLNETIREAIDVVNPGAELRSPACPSCTSAVSLSKFMAGYRWVCDECPWHAWFPTETQALDAAIGGFK